MARLSLRIRADARGAKPATVRAAVHRSWHRPWVIALLLTAGVGALGPVGCGAVAAKDAPADRELTASPAQADGFEAIGWQDLLPKDWSPAADLRDLNVALLGDDDPRAKAALGKLKAAWGTVPTEARLHGRRVGIAGFVVPLDASGRGLREFLLVPHHGACIHVPPPPANQIIHVRLAASVSGVGSMDAVHVEGRLRVTVTETDLARSGYSLDAERLRPMPAPRPPSHALARATHMLPFAATVLPLLVAAALLAWWVRHQPRRTPRELKYAARRRRLQKRQRQRDARAGRHGAVVPHLDEALRWVWRSARARGRSR